MRARWALLLVALTAGTWACQAAIDPDTARFACQSSADCGGGYECDPGQPDGGGLCYPVGHGPDAGWPDGG